MVHRVRATIVPSGRLIDIDLDAAPVILRGDLNIVEQKKGRGGKLVDTIVDTIECTHVHFANGQRWHVAETPNELYSLEPIACFKPNLLDEYNKHNPVSA